MVLFPEGTVASGEVGHDPVGRGESERRSAGQDHGVEPLHHPRRVEQGELARCRRTTSHLARRHGPLREEHHRAAGHGFGIGPVADAHAGDVGDHS